MSLFRYRGVVPLCAVSLSLSDGLKMDWSLSSMWKPQTAAWGRTICNILWCSTLVCVGTKHSGERRSLSSLKLHHFQLESSLSLTGWPPPMTGAAACCCMAYSAAASVAGRSQISFTVRVIVQGPQCRCRRSFGKQAELLLSQARRLTTCGPRCQHFVVAA